MILVICERYPTLPYWTNRTVCGETCITFYLHFFPGWKWNRWLNCRWACECIYYSGICGPLTMHAWSCVWFNDTWYYNVHSTNVLVRTTWLLLCACNHLACSLIQLVCMCICICVWQQDVHENTHSSYEKLMSLLNTTLIITVIIITIIL